MQITLFRTICPIHHPELIILASRLRDVFQDHKQRRRALLFDSSQTAFLHHDNDFVFSLTKLAKPDQSYRNMLKIIGVYPQGHDWKLRRGNTNCPKSALNKVNLTIPLRLHHRLDGGRGANNVVPRLYGL